MVKNNPLKLFRSRYVRAVIGSSLFSQLGIWIRNFAVLLFVMEDTDGDALAVSLVSVAEYGPILLFSLIGGVFADRWRPKKTMVWCEVLSALSVIFVFLMLQSNSFLAVLLSLLGSSILSQFAQPAGMKLFKQHLSETEAAPCMSLLQALFAVFMVVGPILGTWVYGHFGIEITLIIVFTAFLGSAAALLRIPPDPHSEAQSAALPASFLREIGEGFRYVWENPILKRLSFTFAAVGFGVGLISPLGIFLVTEKLGLPAQNIQWLSVPYGLGEIAGGMAAFALSAKIPPLRMLRIGLLCNAIGIATTGLSPVLWLTMLTQGFVALLQPAILIGNQTLVMQHTDSALIGRVTGIRTPLMTGTMLLGMSLSGLLKKAFPLEAWYGAAGLCFLAGFLVLIPLRKNLPAA
ncbi:MFS transporter [Paenibacillus sp. alder61]|uniref:MFS transporter n=1 Tax=Paenibacillus faecis TaxID=862114 RepID=A0A5D0CNN1_9BACL|nr:MULTISPECIES: MFS transporter [Paenibacillus]MCA1296023.1 MFS transporter [Paenibacillus sp. alder61]TYA10845.1 MFS transporter [Paenibacillus faecis]